MTSSAFKGTFFLWSGKRICMILQLTKPQKAIIKTVKDFAKGEFDKDNILDLDKKGVFPDKVWKKAADLGFLGIHLPEKYGGGEMEMTDHMLVAEAFTRHDSTLGAAIMLAGIGAEWGLLFAGDAVKDKYLPGILEGRLLSGTILPKPGVGVTVSETASGKTLYVNGETDGVINGGTADVIFLPLKSPDAGAVVIDSDQSGVAVEKQYQPLGLRMTTSAKITFTDVEIPRENRLSINRGGCRRMLPVFRLLLSALALGTAQGALDRSLAHIKKREQFGRKIGEYQVLRHKLAKMETQLNQARCLTFAAADGFSLKKPDASLTAMACLGAVTAATEITHEAIQLLGGYGYTVEYEVERYCRDAKTLQLISEDGIALYDEIADSLIGKI